MSRWIVLVLLMLMMTMNTFAQEPNARVVNMWEMLNIRNAPTNDGAVVGELTGRTPLFVSGRTRDNRWYQVQTSDGISGWVASGFIELRSIEQAAIPIIFDPQTAPVAETASESAPLESVASVLSDSASNARIIAAVLNVRTAPSVDGSLMMRLPINTRIQAIGRSSDNAWLKAQLSDGTLGWLAAAYVALDVDINTLPIVSGEVAVADVPSEIVSSDEAAQPPPPNGYLAMGASAWNIFANGQALGNQATVFSKIGDSITVAESMFTPIGYGQYNLGDFGYLQATISFFSTPTATGANSFAGVSVAANNGWTTNTVLNQAFANPNLCQAGESPLQCEYRINRPAVALIMFGSNDVIVVPSEEYARNLRTITEFSISQGVIPVLSTIPPRRGFEDRTTFYNQLIRETAAQYGTPLWDYHAAMLTLPDSGLSDDGLHPSAPPNPFENGANFTGDNLRYGYVMRNLTALQVLDTLRREVLAR
ncbi:MAG: SH3 domain-containing protein [Anaerolineae bacterium]|nr:SH3 domain-containing protein [Anaerolineae bacterium]MDQ7036469.1 SH3 domain-containing protein [Anaerolineae bacterium]